MTSLRTDTSISLLRPQLDFVGSSLVMIRFLDLTGPMWSSMGRNHPAWTSSLQPILGHLLNDFLSPSSPSSGSKLMLNIWSLMSPTWSSLDAFAYSVFFVIVVHFCLFSHLLLTNSDSSALCDEHFLCLPLPSLCPPFSPSMTNSSRQVETWQPDAFLSCNIHFLSGASKRLRRGDLKKPAW